MSPFLSHKIKNISFLLMIMVVFLHSYNIDIKQSGEILVFEKNSNWIIQNFISNGLTRIAVPLFFMISGYLFVYGSKLTKVDFGHKIKKRMRTLLVPYLFWTISGLLVYYLLQSFPQSQPFFTKKLIKDYDVFEWINAIFYEPIPYQLWFLRDLIIMSVLSPIICFLIKKLNWIYLSVVFVFWFLNLDSIVLTSEALFFFSLGISISLNKPQIAEKRYAFLPIFLAWIFLLIFKTVAGYNEWDTVGLVVLKIAILAGVVSFWSVYDFISGKERVIKIMDRYSWASFFIYVFHEPALTILKKGLFYGVSKTPLSYLFVYIVAPLVIIVLSILFASFLKKRFGAVYQFVTGSR